MAILDLNVSPPRRLSGEYAFSAASPHQFRTLRCQRPQSLSEASLRQLSDRISVTNLSNFPMTINEVGFTGPKGARRGKRAMIVQPRVIDGKSWPRRLRISVPSKRGARISRASAARHDQVPLAYD